eukprot:TRINITY_DN5997_c0_g1_i3.p1 TRINITY_DN5997_c0_g1~~TRINITY_DN5997_c0_g1_i3.p1  ORF type:complete len:179 (-),score=32.52 TRINITY_DN5997_c0_g1_i3:136-672(-)
MLSAFRPPQLHSGFLSTTNKPSLRFKPLLPTSNKFFLQPKNKYVNTFPPRRSLSTAPLNQVGQLPTNLQKILTAEQNELLQKEYALLQSISSLLETKIKAEPADLLLIRTIIKQLEELFLLVIVGEFNSGKSSLINALLGDKIPSRWCHSHNSQNHYHQIRGQTLYSHHPRSHCTFSR